MFNQLKGHRNIVSFLGVCTSPTFAIMQEFAVFSFKCFGDETEVSTLGQFLQHADAAYDFDGFDHTAKMIANGIIEGVRYLHESEIVHGDLKPAKILVSNVQYANVSEEDFVKFWQSEDAIICKLTDFGESRSRLIQTQTLIKSKVTVLDRGSPAFMSPEILLPDQSIVCMKFNTWKM